MDEKRKPVKKAGPILALLLLLLPVLYVASAGPAAKLVVNRRLNWDTYNAIYAPLLAIGGEVRNALRRDRLVAWVVYSRWILLANAWVGLFGDIRPLEVPSSRWARRGALP